MLARVAVLLCAVVCVPMCHALPIPAVAGAASTDPAGKSAAPAPNAINPAIESSSNAALPDTSTPVTADAGQAAGSRPLRTGMKPFSAVAVQVKVGTAGIGLDVAVPVAGRLNLRAGGSFFSYNPNLVTDGINVVGNIQLRSGSANVDIFPFGNSFRISPGVVFYNGDNITATANVPAGQSFTLNSIQYYSSASAPVTGTFGLSFGNKVAPSFTLGFGNMLPRKGGHWSVPFEIGGEYIGQTPMISLALTGTACQGGPTTNCSSIASNSMTQQNIAAEQTSLNSNIPSQLVFLPIVSIGVSYKFGNSGSK
jgi:hypothetical protein